MSTAEEWARIEKYACPIQGWASKRELCALFDSAKACTEGAIVEIGSWKGKSTTALGLGSRAGRNITVYAIDPHTGSPDHRAKHAGEDIWTFDEFKKNMEKTGLTSIVEPILDYSDRLAPAWKKPIELLYLDVNYHDYKPGLEDFITWGAFVMNGGTIALHNPYPSLSVIVKEGQPFHGWPSPRKVLRKLVFGKKGWRNIRIVDSTVFMQKCAESNFTDLIRGRLVQCQGMFLVLLRKLYGLLILLPVPLKKTFKRIVVSRSKD